MTKVIRGAFIFLMFGMVSCQDEISFESDNSRLLIVDGSISDRAGIHTVRLAYSSGFTSDSEGGLEEPVRNAIVEIEDNQGTVVRLSEGSLGNYNTPSGFLAVVGNSYVLSITTPDGNQYRSDPEVLRPSGDMGNVYYELDTREVINEENNIVEELIVNFYSDFEFPEKGMYYKWEWDGTFVYETTYTTFEERRDEQCDRADPTGIPEVCYVNEFPDGGFVNILDSEESSSLEHNRHLLLSKKVDFNWSVRYAMHLVQLSMTQSTYEFWQEVEEQVERSGSIFDPVPSKIIGNVHNTSNQEEEVLGNFSVYGYQDVRVFVSDVPVGDELNSCLVPLITFGDRHPDYCCDCSQLDPDNNRTSKPDYWVD